MHEYGRKGTTGIGQRGKTITGTQRFDNPSRKCARPIYSASAAAHRRHAGGLIDHQYRSGLFTQNRCFLISDEGSCEGKDNGRVAFERWVLV